MPVRTASKRSSGPISRRLCRPGTAADSQYPWLYILPTKTRRALRRLSRVTERHPRVCQKGRLVIPVWPPLGRVHALGRQSCDGPNNRVGIAMVQSEIGQCDDSEFVIDIPHNVRRQSLPCATMSHDTIVIPVPFFSLRTEHAAGATSSIPAKGPSTSAAHCRYIYRVDRLVNSRCKMLKQACHCLRAGVDMALKLLGVDIGSTAGFGLEHRCRQVRTTPRRDCR